MISNRCVKQYRDWETVNRPWDSRLIIGMSSDADTNKDGQSLPAGMNLFIVKPIKFEMLFDLECSGQVVFRTRQLDEFKSTASKSTD
jgi:PleD family two-component response regulator